MERVCIFCVEKVTRPSQVTKGKLKSERKRGKKGFSSCRPRRGERQEFILQGTKVPPVPAWIGFFSSGDVEGRK